MKKISSFVLTLLPLFSIANGFANPLQSEFAAGFFLNKQAAYPLIIKKLNNTQWNYANNIPITSQHLSRYIQSISNSGNFIIAGGFADELNTAPFLLQSQDNAQTWSYVSQITALPFMVDSVILGSSCTGNICLANGFYSTNQMTQPLLLITHDKGKTWNSINDIKNYPLTKGGVIDYASCEGKACVGIFDTSHDKITDFVSTPMVSLDKGYTWSLQTINNLPEKSIVHLYALKCKDNTCIGGGSLSTEEEATHHRKPLLINSEDGGKNWRHIKDINNLPRDFNHGKITAISTINNKWLAVGEYAEANASEVSRPLILSSLDKGQHWTFVNITTDLPHHRIKPKSLVCQDSYCVIGGYYLNDEENSFESPLILVSHDRGHSFKCITKINNLPKMKGATIDSVNCMNGSCTGVGHFDDDKSGDRHKDAISLPFLVSSADRGNHWTVTKINNLPTMESGDIAAITGNHTQNRKH